MTGIFDSGRGGLTALSRLRELKPLENIIYFGDKENAPYGNKTPKEILALTESGIERLVRLGCQRVLIACCTASTVHGKLREDLKNVSLPIIRSGAKAAWAVSDFGRVGVISTEATYRSLAFVKALEEIDGGIQVVSSYSSALVKMIEDGVDDGNIDSEGEEFLKKILSPFSEGRVDTLILGCTHFTHLKNSIEKITGIPTVSPSFVGAEAMAEMITSEEDGTTVFI